jgi:hypothetical protein
MGKRCGETAKRAFDFGRTVPSDHSQRSRLAGKRRLRRDADQLAAADRRQQLVGPAHAARLAGREQQGGAIAQRLRQLRDQAAFAARRFDLLSFRSLPLHSRVTLF